MQALPDNKYYPGLDSLRGIAVLTVVLFHFFPSFNYLSWGWMGVDLFFVISGFLITSILLRSKPAKTNFFKYYFARRALRIVPLSFTILIIFFVSVALSDHQNRFSFYKENWWYYFLFLQNWLFVIKGLPHEYYLNHFWSLAVEEQFYLFFPVTVYFLSKKKLVNLILFLLPLIFLIRVFIWYFHTENLPAYYCNTFTRIDSILFGCLLGCGITVKKVRIRIFLATLTFSIIIGGALYYRSALYSNPLIATIGYTAIGLLNYLFLATFISNEKSFLFIRKNIFLNYIGEISYGIYLFHVPVFLICTSLSHKFLAGYASEPLIGILSIVVTLLLSSISFYTLERYFLRLKRYFPVHSTRQHDRSLTNRIAEKIN